MQQALNDINNQRINFLNKCIDTRISSTKLTNIDATDFINSLNDFIRFIKPTIDYEEFILINIDKFKLLKRILVGEDKAFYNNCLDDHLIRTLKQLYDKIYISIKYNEITDEKLITKIFTNFVKGVTYFKSSIYKPGEYGNNIQTIECKFKKTMLGHKKNISIEQYYIERTIYNILYQKLLYSQNLQNRLKYLDITQIYQSYYPNVYIDIEIEYLTNIYYPIRIIINKLDVISKAMIETQIYTKTINPITFVYDDIIRCEKKDINHNYSKTQTFDNEEAWRYLFHRFVKKSVL